MRRTTAAKLLCPIGVTLPWAEIPCRSCPTVGVTILATSIDERGASERAYCGPGCAVLDGWPWLRGERDRAPVVGQASLFEGVP